MIRRACDQIEHDVLLDLHVHGEGDQDARLLVGAPEPHADSQRCQLLGTADDP
ncbi:MAG: hypothetical protein R6X29_12240 [Acidimicrobiia bacterium]